MKKIMLAGFTAEQAAAVVRAFPQGRFISPEPREAPALIGAVDALVGLHRAAFDAILTDEVVRDGRQLRWVHASGAGIDQYLVPALVAGDIIFTNGKIIQGPHVADHALALLLSLSRNLHLALRGDAEVSRPRPIELRGKTAVVVGCGGVGLLICERLSAFGMDVAAVNEQNIPMLRMLKACYMPDQLAEVIPAADVVVVAAPLTPRSRRLFGPKEFAAMKASALFVNVSRGGLVDTQALVAALEKGQLSAAALDVTDPEPLALDHPLRRMRNVIVTPHLAGLSDHNHRRGFELVMENIRRFLNELPLLNVVDKKAGY